MIHHQKDREGADPVPARGLAGPAAGRAYYNEWEPFAAQWLRNLAAAGEISAGHVDETSITEVSPDALKGFNRAHFFAGIGGWDLALKLAGWPDNQPVWTGSCPCQPFSAAGKRAGIMDARHLWPNFLALIRACKPATIFGEQVASKDGRVWLDGVRADLEALGYEVGAADLCAAGISAPHIRQRLFWVADTPSLRRERVQQEPGSDGKGDEWTPGAGEDGWPPIQSARGGAGIRRMAHAQGVRLEGRHNGRERIETGSSGLLSPGSSIDALRMEHAESDGRKQWRPESSRWGASGRRGADGKWRRIEPGIEPLAHGVPGRVGKLRAYGNAIVPQVATEFIRAFLEAQPARSAEQSQSPLQDLLP